MKNKTMKMLSLVAVMVIVCLFTGAALAVTVTTLEELQNAFAAGGEVTLGANIDAGAATVQLPKNVSVVLNLNGYELSGKTTEKLTSNHALINMKQGSSLVVNGDGSIVYEHAGESDNYKYAAQTIANNQATLTVNGGDLSNNTNVSKQISYVIDTLTNGGEGNATTTINGGTISSPYYIATRIFANSTSCTGTLNITGGDFTGRVQVHDANGKANKAVLNISDGTFTANTNDALYIYADGESSNLSVSVTGGEFNGPVRSVNGSGEAVTGFISGGSFSQQPADDLIDPNLDAVKIGNTWYIGELPAGVRLPSVPKTGDASSLSLWAMMLMLSAVGMIMLGKKRFA